LLPHFQVAIIVAMRNHYGSQLSTRSEVRYPKLHLQLGATWLDVAPNVFKDASCSKEELQQERIIELEFDPAVTLAARACQWMLHM
jgi:hypothetical protein